MSVIMPPRFKKLFSKIKHVPPENRFLSQEYGSLIKLEGLSKEYNLPFGLSESQMFDIMAYVTKASVEKNKLGGYVCRIEYFKNLPLWKESDCIYLEEALYQEILKLNPDLKKINTNKSKNDLIQGVISRYIPEDIDYFINFYFNSERYKSCVRGKIKKDYGNSWVPHPKTLSKIKRHLSKNKLDIKRVKYLSRNSDYTKLDYLGIEWLCLIGKSFETQQNIYEYKNMRFIKENLFYRGIMLSHNPNFHTLSDKTKTLKEMCHVIDRRLRKDSKVRIK